MSSRRRSRNLYNNFLSIVPFTYQSTSALSVVPIHFEYINLVEPYRWSDALQACTEITKDCQIRCKLFLGDEIKGDPISVALSIVINQPFDDGNHRTALKTMSDLLMREGLYLKSKADLYTAYIFLCWFGINNYDRKKSELYLRQWVKRNFSRGIVFLSITQSFSCDYVINSVNVGRNEMDKIIEVFRDSRMIKQRRFYKKEKQHRYYQYKIWRIFNIL